MTELQVTQAVAAPAIRGASPWLRFAGRRLGQLLVSALVLITASFLIIHLVPGDPVRAALGLDASQQLVDARRAQLGLSNPLWLQYTDYLRNLCTGRFGTSITSGLPASARTSSTGYSSHPVCRSASPSRRPRSASRAAWRSAPPR
jgi:peptide/nickel transport system permease protein